MTNDIQQRSVNRIKQYMAVDSVKTRLNDMLGKRSGAFTNSIINIVSSNNALQKCTPESICSEAMKAASFNLPIDPALGQAAIVPYGNKAQFQLMYKGVTQLCIRSGQYATIHCTEVYKDEIESWNPITGMITFTDQDTWCMRDDGDPKNVAGHFATFKLLAGFEKSDYMSCREAMSHAKKYSKSYQYDLRDKKNSSKWSTDPVAMGNKTVLLRLLNRYGIMSIEMQEAFIHDNEDFSESQQRNDEIIDGQMGQTVVDDAKPNTKPGAFVEDEI